MIKFYKTAVEYNKLAKAFNGMNGMLQNLIPQIRMRDENSDFSEEIMVLAYIARKGILDRIEDNDWALEAKIYIPTIQRGKMTIMYALSQTVWKLTTIADSLDLRHIVEEVFDKGELYYTLEDNLPQQLIKDI